MAEAADFPGTNFTFAAPEGREDISDLRIFTNGHANVSAWRLTDEELADVNRTGCVFLSVLSGRTFYPVYLGSEESVRRLVADYGPVWTRDGESSAPVHEPIQPELTDTYEQTRGVACSLGGTTVMTPKGPVRILDAPGITTLFVKHPGDAAMNRVGVLLYTTEPSGLGMIGQLDADTARTTAASLLRLADELDPGKPN